MNNSTLALFASSVKDEKQEHLNLYYPQKGKKKLKKKNARGKGTRTGPREFMHVTYNCDLRTNAKRHVNTHAFKRYF